MPDFIPKNQNDWRLLLMLAECTRLASRRQILAMVEAYALVGIEEEEEKET